MEVPLRALCQSGTITRHLDSARLSPKRLYVFHPQRTLSLPDMGAMSVCYSLGRPEWLFVGLKKLYADLIGHLPACIDLERPERTLCWHDKTVRLSESLFACMKNLRNVGLG